MKESSERRTSDGIRIYAPEDFDGMRAAGHLVARCLDMIGDHVQPGVTTGELDRIVQDFVEGEGATSATIGYRGYQHASCISVNHVVCHGIPGKPIPMMAGETVSKDPEKTRKDDTLQDGDIVNIDVTAILDGWFGDTSRMYVAGRANRRASRLIEVTHEALMRGIEAVKPGNTFGDIGHAIQSYAEGERCAVVRDFCGHGLGRVFHDAPNVLHYGQPGEGAVMEPGMIFTIEPMVNLGTALTRTLSDDWTAITRDKALSAQFEHSIGVTQTGYEIFTLSPEDKFFPTF